MKYKIVLTSEQQAFLLKLLDAYSAQSADENSMCADIVKALTVHGMPTQERVK